jgi:hypothetical protein
VLNSLIIDVAIGLVFVLVATTVAASCATEMVARILALRAEYLLRGLRSLLDGDARSPAPVVTAALLGTGILRNQGHAGQWPAADVAYPTLRRKRQLPAYIPARSFARAVVDLLRPDGARQVTMPEVRSAVDGWEEGVFKESLQALLKSIDDDMDAFRCALEQWYDDHMARVSGWYKRRTRWVSMGIGAVVVLALNINAVTITRSLYTDELLRETVVAAAVEASAGSAACRAEGAVHCLAQVRGQIANLRGTGLPLGWGTVPACAGPPGPTGPGAVSCDWLERLGFTDPARGTAADLGLATSVLFGFVLTVATLIPGSRFWFDLLSQLGTLRSTGPRPPSPGR